MTRLLVVTYPWNMTLLHLVDCLFWRAATQGSQATIALKKFCLTAPAANMNMPGRSLEGIFTECKLAGGRVAAVYCLSSFFLSSSVDSEDDDDPVSRSAAIFL